MSEVPATSCEKLSTRYADSVEALSRFRLFGSRPISSACTVAFKFGFRGSGLGFRVEVARCKVGYEYAFVMDAIMATRQSTHKISFRGHSLRNSCLIQMAIEEGLQCTEQI